ncbi:MAG TPA: ABC transporter permease [Alphaproteobacteria bacterium]
MTTEQARTGAGRGGFGPVQRSFGAVNWIGLWTLYVKEVRRFLKVPGQTLLAPCATTLLYLAIFALALGGAVREIHGIPFLAFLGPGLIAMAIVQNAFANTVTSVMISKVQGNIVDMLVPPLSPGELTLAFALGGLTRGVAVGVAVAVAIFAFVPTAVHDWAAVVCYGLGASLMLSLVGLATAVWADKFDQTAAITNFVVTPLAFLSGTFYSIDRLPEPWHAISLFNPFFYMIDGMRYGFTGHADGSIAVGAAVLVAADLALYGLCYWMFATGYKLKE